LEIIREKTIIFLPSSRIVDQTLCFKNEHFLPKKLDKPIFLKNLDNFFYMFPISNYGNTLLVDDMLHKNMFNPLFNAIFLQTLYSSKVDDNYLLGIVLPYLESLHSFGMRISKLLESNPFGSITHVLPSDLRYEKLALQCCSKCDDTFCTIG
jgi:hypothetical protein